MARTFDPIREMDRLLSDVTRTPATVAVPMDLYREGDDYTVAVDLPGVDPASIDIDVDDRTLTIRAERAAKVAKEAQWLSRERAMGTFAPSTHPRSWPGYRSHHRRVHRRRADFDDPRS